jgi:hypothetical protein
MNLKQKNYIEKTKRYFCLKNQNKLCENNDEQLLYCLLMVLD